MDLLIMENEAFELAANPDQDVKDELEAGLEDPDQGIDTELAEELKSGLDVNDRGTMPEKDGELSAVQDTEREQTRF